MEGLRDLALTVLDHELVDLEGERSGRVDDIELELRADGTLMPVALVVGREAAHRRLGGGRFGALVRRLLPVEERRVGWDQIEEITHVVKLRSRQSNYRLARSETRLAQLLERMPKG
jgi:hypothetical protein